MVRELALEFKIQFIVEVLTMISYTISSMSMRNNFYSGWLWVFWILCFERKIRAHLSSSFELKIESFNFAQKYYYYSFHFQGGYILWLRLIIFQLIGGELSDDMSDFKFRSLPWWFVLNSRWCFLRMMKIDLGYMIYNWWFWHRSFMGMILQMNDGFMIVDEFM
jgi:hypothetical protein